MLDEENRKHRERIEGRLREIMSETYWNFVSTPNQESTEGRRSENSERASSWHRVGSDTPVVHEPMKYDVGSTFNSINPAHHSATSPRVSVSENTPLLPASHVIPDTTGIVQYDSEPLVSSDIGVIFDLSQAPSPGGVGDKQIGYLHPTPQLCSDPTQNSFHIEP
jgi:hypothetical protein